MFVDAKRNENHNLIHSFLFLLADKKVLVCRCANSLQKTAQRAAVILHFVLFENKKFYLLQMAHYSLRYCNKNSRIMKDMWQRLIMADRYKGQNKVHPLFMIAVFLAFWGVSFYVLVNSIA